MCSLSDESYISLWRYLLGSTSPRSSAPGTDRSTSLCGTSWRTRAPPHDKLGGSHLGPSRRRRPSARPASLRGAREPRYRGAGSVLSLERRPFPPLGRSRRVGTVEQVEVAPDIALPVEALGAVYLGGVPLQAWPPRAGSPSASKEQPGAPTRCSACGDRHFARRTSEPEPGHSSERASSGGPAGRIRPSGAATERLVVLRSSPAARPGLQVHGANELFEVGWHVKNST